MMKIAATGYMFVFLLLAGCVASRPCVGEADQHVCRFPVRTVQALILSGKPDVAINTILQPTLQQLATIKKVDTRRLYCSRTGAETLLYLLTSAKDGGSAVVIDYGFALAYFCYAHIHVEQGDLGRAEVKLRQALELSPSNPVFLSEQGYLYQRKSEWTKALELYDEALAATEAFSPEESKVLEKGKALRGRGYSLVELDRLQEANEAYQECLSIDPNDRVARAELDYVEKLQKKQGTNK
jgi:tetratricopeptide (TPR) repeat protein